MDFIYLNLLNLLGDFSLFQVLTGAVLLLASVILTFQIKKNIPDDLRTEWRKTSNFILLFFTVYVFFILVLLGKLSYSIQPVTASLFLVSACFVYLIMMLIKTFTLKIRDKDVEIKGFIEKLKDNNESLEHEITVRRKTEERLRLYEKAVETMQIGVTIADTRGIITYTNPADALMHGFDPEELAGKDVGTYAPAGHRKPLTVERMLDIDTHKREGVNVRRDGSLFPVQLISSAVLNPDGEPIGVVTVCEDITERKQAEEKLVMYKDHLEELVRARTAELTRAFGELKSETLQRRSAEDKVTFMAYHDSLTGLPNRYSLLDMLSKMLDRARGSGRPIAAMFLDLDNFKRINDTLGHGVGDRLLQGVAERLSGSLRPNDAAVHVEDGELKNVVSRLGGDEFVVLLADLNSGQDADKVAARLLGAIARPFNLDGHEVFITTSIGISMFPEHGEDPENLLKHADFAMYHAKGQGRNTFRSYKEEVHTIALGRVAMEQNLITALKRDEFHVCYQPQFNTTGGGVVGIESLVRWRHPELGLVSPAEFIPVAEENGLIVPIGEWILRTVCSHYNRWKFHAEQDFRVAVNLSGYQFRHSNLMETIKRALDEFDMPAHSLEIELTEGVIMRDAEETVTILKALKEMGIRISIDDFGTGYSSLSYLKRFPIDTLKIDQSFVRDVSKSKDDASIVKTIIAMGHSLNMTVIAEGVETQEQLEFLRDNGCDAMQGYLFCKPLPQEDVSRLIENNWNFGG